MEEMDMMYNLEYAITKALKEKTLIPKIIYNIKIDFAGLDSVLDKLFVKDLEDRINSSDIKACKDLLYAAGHRGVCKTFLSTGLPIHANANFKDAFTSSVMLWITTSMNNSKMETLLDLDDDSSILVIEDELMKIVDNFIEEIKTLDPDIIDISDFFTYIHHDYVSIDECIMYKSINDSVISILRF